MARQPSLTPRSPLEPAVEAFLDHLERSGRSPRTCRAYRADLRQLGRFLHAYVREGAPSLGGLNEEIALAFADELAASGAQPNTVRRKLAAVRAFGRFLTAAGILARNPARGVSGPQPETSSRPGTDLTQIEAALSLLPEATLAGARARAMVAVLYGAGLRLGELADLNLTSIDLDEGVVHVQGRRERAVPLGTMATEAIRAYLPRRAESLIRRDIATVEAGSLFVNDRGRRLHRRSIQRIVRQSLEEGARGGELEQDAAKPAPARSPGEAGPRSLRRAFAAHLLEAGADVASVRALLGQDALPASGGGARLSVDDLRARYERAHPRAR
jgi:site-specific recombinase XerD